MDVNSLSQSDSPLIPENQVTISSQWVALIIAVVPYQWGTINSSVNIISIIGGDL